MPVTHPFLHESPRKALVAIEDARTQSYLQEALSRVGYRSEICSDFRRMLEPFRTAGSAFVALNEEPERLEVVRRLRREGISVPAILLSPAPGRLSDCGVPDVVRLATPFTLRTLQAAIARALPTPV